MCVCVWGMWEQPIKQQSLKELKEFSYSNLIVIRLERYIGNVKRARGCLKLEKRELMNGTRKNELTRWWLRYIEEKCAEFLQSTGDYKFEEIPKNYTHETPKNLEAIRTNLATVRKVLDKNNQTYRPLIIRLVDSITSEIYSRIDGFIQQALIVICEYLAVDHTKTDFETIKRLFKSQKQKLSDDLVIVWISDMLKDVKYLRQMKIMEKAIDNPTAAGDTPQKAQKLILSNVVPASGLVFSYFYRQENVLQTILELFDRPKTRSLTPTNIRSNNSSTWTFAPKERKPQILKLSATKSIPSSWKSTNDLTRLSAQRPISCSAHRSDLSHSVNQAVSPFYSTSLPDRKVSIALPPPQSFHPPADLSLNSSSPSLVCSSPVRTSSAIANSSLSPLNSPSHSPSHSRSNSLQPSQLPDVDNKTVHFQ